MKKLMISVILLFVAASFVCAEEGRDASGTIKKMLDELGYKYALTESGNIMLDFDLQDDDGKPTGRSHRVIIAKTTDKWGPFEVIKVAATVMKIKDELDKTKANQLLIENSIEKFGKWVVIRSDAGYRIMYEVRMSIRDPASVMQKALLNVFGRADAMEKLWTGKDDF